MLAPSDREFLSALLKVAPCLNTDDFGNTFIARNRLAAVNGMGMSFDFHNTLNEKHYAAVSTDILLPLQPAYCALQYGDGSSAAVAYTGRDYKAFATGFPLECIRSQQARESVLRGIMQFLFAK